MNDALVLERLSVQYASLPAPAPSAALAARMDAGLVGEDDDSTPGAVAVPLVRPGARVRYLVAAVVAGFVVFSGLAAAGALPDPVQRGISSLVSHVGIDLPSPGDGHDAPRPPSHSDHAGSPNAVGASSESSTTTSTTVAGAAPGATSPPVGAPAGGVLGGVGAIGAGATTTTPPAPGGVELPPVTVPGVTLPPVTLPTITLPPVTLPQITLPPITLPALPLPPLPILGL